MGRDYSVLGDLGETELPLSSRTDLNLNQTWLFTVQESKRCGERL